MKQLKQFTFALSSALILSALSPAARAGSGTPLWTNFYSGVPYAVAVDGQGNAVVVGVSTGSGGAPVVATVKCSGAGVPLWTNLYPFAAGCDFAGYFPLMAVDNSGNVFVAGASCNFCPDLATVAYGCLAYATVAYAQSVRRRHALTGLGLGPATVVLVILGTGVLGIGSSFSPVMQTT